MSTPLFLGKEARKDLKIKRDGTLVGGMVSNEMACKTVRNSGEGFETPMGGGTRVGVGRSEALRMKTVVG